MDLCVLVMRYVLQSSCQADIGGVPAHAYARRWRRGGEADHPWTHGLLAFSHDGTEVWALPTWCGLDLGPGKLQSVLPLGEWAEHPTMTIFCCHSWAASMQKQHHMARLNVKWGQSVRISDRLEHALWLHNALCVIAILTLLCCVCKQAHLMLMQDHMLPHKCHFVPMPLQLIICHKKGKTMSMHIGNHTGYLSSVIYKGSLGSCILFHLAFTMYSLRGLKQLLDSMQTVC